MHIGKSALVFLFIVTLTIWLSYAIRRIIAIIKHREIKEKNKIICFCIICICALLLISHLLKYTNPCDKVITPQLFHSIRLEDDVSIPYPGLPWHAIYEQYGLYAASFFIEPDDETDHHFGFTWPEMDFKHHTYIVSYGWEIESLSYNIWETLDYPIKTGACVGHVVYTGDFQSNMVFIYELPKIRIEHDINND